MRAWRAASTIVAFVALLAIPHPAQPQSSPPSAAKSVPVDLELVLAVDVSRSIDADEFDLQRQGYARAITNQSVLSAIQTGAIGSIAITHVQMSGAHQPKTLADRTLIRRPQPAQA